MADANYDDVALLIPGIGENNSTTIIDYSPSYRSITAAYDAKISTAQSKFYGSSLAFDGGNDKINVPNSDDFWFGSAITIEFWIRPAEFSRTQYLLAHKQGTDTGWAITLKSSNQINLTVWNTGGGEAITGVPSTALPTLNTWYHVRIVFDNPNTYVFIDGALSNSISSVTGSISGASANLSIGYDPANFGRVFNGYLNDIRITAGVARSASGFTVPTQFCPSITGVAKIGSTPAQSLRAYSIGSPSGQYLPTATPDGSGDYTLYTADVKQVVVCHHDDPDGTVTTTPEAAVVEAGGTANFYGVSDGANNVGGINSILLSTL